MAVRKLDTELNDAESYQSYPLSPEPEPEDVELMRVLSELGTGENELTVNVYRCTATNKKGGAYLFTCGASEFTLEHLRDAYGGGEYRVHVRNSQTLVANKRVVIEEPKPGSSLAVQQSNGIDALEKAMADGFNQLGQLMLQSSQRPAVDPDAMEEKFLSKMLIMKQLFAQPQQGSATGSMKEIIESISMLKDVSRDLNPSDVPQSETSMMLEAFKSLGQILPLAAQVQSANQPHHPPQPPQLPQLPQPPADVNKEVSEVDMFARIYLKMLIGKAKIEGDPDLYADFILDNVPTPFVLNFVLAPNWFDELCKENPDAAPHRAWFEKLKTSIENVLREEGLLTPEEKSDTPIDNVPTQNATADGSIIPNS